MKVVLPLLTLRVVVTFLPHVEGKQVCQKTILYSFTFPPQKEHTTILCHPVGQELKRDNDSNIQFNAGIMAAHTSVAIKCPSGHTKSFCSGWDFVRKFG